VRLTHEPISHRRLVRLDPSSPTYAVPDEVRHLSAAGLGSTAGRECLVLRAWSRLISRADAGAGVERVPVPRVRSAISRV
jgi:hypothetical protein